MESEISYSPIQNNSGLLRYRSAPSTFLANWDEKSEKDYAETLGLTSTFSSQSVLDMEYKEAKVNGYALNSQLPPQYPRTRGSHPLGSVNGGYKAKYSLGSDLMRQNSFSAQNGCASMRSVGGYGFSRGNAGDLSPSSNRQQSYQMEYSSAMPYTLGMLSRISQVANETGGLNSNDDRKLGIGDRDPGYHVSNLPLPFSSWNHSTRFADNLSCLKREIDSDDQNFSPKTQGGGQGNRPHMLSHHLSLPKTSAEIAAMDKLLQLQGTVPCKLRAKRGCATHPRSIAERVRRTRISERIKKLQELVPNMEKQTNTADMLDLAVEYIKELQEQYKTLSDIGAKCECSAMQKPLSEL